jgi:cysteine desulfurase
MFYLDNAATTPLDPDVLKVMIEFLQNEYGNPSSKYYPQAMSAQNYLTQARNDVAKLIGCESEYVLFTSGATESNNFVIKGVAEKYSKKGKHIITSKVEHKSILEACKHLEKQGFHVTYLDIDHNGQVNLEQLRQSITDETTLVSIIWGNNEIGTLNNIKEIGEICKNQDILFHTDATQVIGKVPVNLNSVHVDFLSISAHKLYGPKGIGAIYVGPDDLGLRRKLPSLLDGGNQEYKMRAGTHSMHNIVGFGKACEIAAVNMDKYIPEILKRETALKNALLDINSDITFNGDQESKIPGLLSINIPGINNELFCKQISQDVALSTGSACSIGEKSYVLEALNLKEDTTTIRLALNKYDLDLDELLKILRANLTQIIQ